MSNIPGPGGQNSQPLLTSGVASDPTAESMIAPFHHPGTNRPALARLEALAVTV